MMVLARSVLQRWQRQLRILLGRPWGKLGLQGLIWLGCGFLAAAASVRDLPQPLGAALALSRGKGAGTVMALGALAGYRFFWGPAGEPGLLWSLGALVLGLLEIRRDPWRLLSGGAMVLTAALALGAAPEQAALHTALGTLFLWALLRQDALGKALGFGCAGLALAQVTVTAWLGLGPVLVGGLILTGPFPWAILAGLGLDLARITAVPVCTAVMAGWLLTRLPERLRWGAPALGCCAVSLLTGVWDLRLLPGLLAGGAAGALLPRPRVRRVPGATGAAQVKLELTASVLGDLGRFLRELPAPSIDREALLQHLRLRSCGKCPHRRKCLEQSRLTETVLESRGRFPCRGTQLLQRELDRSREQLRLLKTDHRRREEYRRSLGREFTFLEEYLRSLADSLPRQDRTRARYRLQLGVRTRGKDRISGDRWAAFPGSRGRYYLLLCDGMGSGPGAREAGSRALSILRRLLQGDFPPEKALMTLNDILTLGSRPGLVTLDLAVVRLDQGTARLYKWGSPPAWRVKNGRAEALGTTGPPPGMDLDRREQQLGADLRSGELLILASDGVDREELPQRLQQTGELSPGAAAERLLEGQGEEDDATVMALRLSRN